MMVRIEINEIENRKQRESVEPKVSFIKKKNSQNRATFT